MIPPENKLEEEAISTLQTIGLPETTIEPMIKMIRNGDIEGAFVLARVMLSFIESAQIQSVNETIH